jgi:hypothetical protein
MCWMLGVAAEDHDRCHGDEGGEEYEDAGLDALECPVPAGGLVGDQRAVSVSSQAGTELERTLEDERPARGRHVADGHGHAAEGNAGPAGAWLLGTWPPGPTTPPETSQ